MDGEARWVGGGGMGGLLVDLGHQLRQQRSHCPHGLPLCLHRLLLAVCLLLGELQDSVLLLLLLLGGPSLLLLLLLG